MSVSLWPHGRTMGFSRQEYKSGLPYPSPGDLPNPGIEPRSPALQADALPSELPGKPIVSSYSPPSLLSWLCCSAALLSVGKAGLNEPHICLPWSLVIMVDGKHQADMVWGVRDQGIFSNHHCLDTASRMVIVFFPDYSPGWGLFLISSPTELYSLYFPLLLKL